MTQPTPDPDLGRKRSLRNRPVLLSNLVAALVLEVCVLLRSFGVPLNDAQADAINGVAGLLLLIGASLYAERRTTPLADPRNHHGQPLVPTPTAPPAPPVTPAMPPSTPPELPPDANPIGGQSAQ